MLYIREYYRINTNTLAIQALDTNVSKVIEQDKVFIINEGLDKIMDFSCKNYGSSYQGRIESTKLLLNNNSRLPLVVEESNNILFIPTASIRNPNCMFISLNEIENYHTDQYGTAIVSFKNGTTLSTNISLYSFEKQYNKAHRLLLVLNCKKNLIKEIN